jgi:hypothetical protein
MAKTLSLPERIESIRADIDELIDERVEIERQNCPGVPAGVLRNLITRHSGCQCEVWLQLEKAEA